MIQLLPDHASLIAIAMRMLESKWTSVTNPTPFPYHSILHQGNETRDGVYSTDIDGVGITMQVINSDVVKILPTPQQISPGDSCGTSDIEEAGYILTQQYGDLIGGRVSRYHYYQYKDRYSIGKARLLNGKIVTSFRAMEYALLSHQVSVDWITDTLLGIEWCTAHWPCIPLTTPKGTDILFDIPTAIYYKRETT